MVPAKGSILHPFLASCWLFFCLASGSSSRSPLLPVPALISSALIQSLVSLCLFPAKPFPLGLLPAGPDRSLFSKGKCLHTSSPFPFLAAAWCIPSSQPHSWHTSPGDGLGSISSRLEYLLLRLSPKFPLAAFQKRAPNPSGLAVPPHSAEGDISRVFPPKEFRSGCYFLLDLIFKQREEKKKKLHGRGRREEQWMKIPL